VAGRTNDRAFAAACAELANRLGYPIFADPLSGLRFGSHTIGNVLGFGDQLAATGALDMLRPEVALRFGPVPTSKPVWAWLGDHPEVDQVLIDMHSRDATNSARTTIELDPTMAAAAIGEAVAVPAPTGWLDAWLELDTIAAELVGSLVDESDFPNEPAVARIVTSAAASGSAIVLGSSMPIRDVDAFAGKDARRLHLFGNRGANGIDGLTSAALGIAASGLSTLVLTGDVSMLHDVNSLATAARLDLPVTIVVVNNDGGGIFHFLPQNDDGLMDPDVFENYLGTPHGTDFVAIAEAFGVEAQNVDDADALSDLVSTRVSGPRLIQVRTDRRANLELHRGISAELGALVKSRRAESTAAGT
jgi:2-succinyl-5-enolpyruvyl-6-hydroxy-3-cyclohexene-1-carboxylate synthase